jgi:hypothetical protein
MLVKSAEAARVGRTGSRRRLDRDMLSASNRNTTQDNSMKYILLLLLAVSAAMGQTSTASIAGTVLDAKTLKPVPAALVIASRAGAPPFTRNTKSGGDGAYQVQGLTPGNYLVCVQASGGQYLDPCQAASRSRSHLPYPVRPATAI